MYTYQDLIQIDPTDEKKRMAFVRAVISDHKSSEDYKTAIDAVEYDHKRNKTIIDYEKTLNTISGKKVKDTWSANHKTTRNFFSFFTDQENQYLLGNGVTWQNDETAKKLGDNFDTQLQKAGKAALVQKEAFGFFNLDRVDIFEFKEFAPLLDEENGSLRAGVRFWQIDEHKPLRAVLYEEDGYTGYIWGELKDDNSRDEEGRVYTPKRPYIVKTRTTALDGTEIYDGMNYPTFPIVPLWGNEEHQSELVGIREQIDAYDLIKNGFLNDLDSAQLYWIIKGAGGMDDYDLTWFLHRLKTVHAAAPEDGQEVQPVEVNIPYEARERILDRLERDLYKDYGALDVDAIKGGAVTATQVIAAYEPLDIKANKYEYCIIEFIKGILAIAGIEDNPSFTRSRIVNATEEINSVLASATVLDEEYVTEKILTLLGDGDQAEAVKERKAADELERGKVTEQLLEEIENGSGTQTDGQDNKED